MQEVSMRTVKQKPNRSSQFLLLPVATGTFCLWVMAIGLAPFLLGCNKESTPSASAQAATTKQTPLITNARNPQWVVYPNSDQPPHEIALVFVHGIFGDAQTTWQNANGTRFFDLVHDNPKVGKY